MNDTLTDSKRRGPYLSYLADPVAKVPKVSRWRKQQPCDVLSTTASQNFGEEVSRRLSSPVVNADNSANEPVEYNPIPSTLSQESTNEEGWENSCVGEPVEDTSDDEAQAPCDCSFDHEPALFSSLLSGDTPTTTPANDVDDSGKYADDEEFEYEDSEDETSPAGMMLLIFLNDS